MYIDFTHHGMRLYKSTGIKVDPNYWDKKRSRAKISVNYPSAKNINKSINDFESMTLDKFSELQKELNRNPSKEELSESIFGTDKRAFGFKEFCLQFLADNPNNLANKTIDGYKTTVSKIESFHTKLGVKDKSLDQVDYAYFTAFISHCRKTGDSESNINDRRIKNFKTLMKNANMLGYTANQIHLDSRIKRKTLETVHEVIRSTEIEPLLNLELTGKNELYRDFIVFGIFVGARISDLKKLSKRNLYEEPGRKGDYYLRYRSKKSKKTITVPLHSTALKLWKKHGFNICPPVTEQTLNKAIKRICEMLDTMHLERNYIDSNGNEYSSPRYKEITAHSLRRSFCTRLAEMGMPLQQIREFSGHKTMQALERYIKSSLDLTDLNIREKYF